VGEGKKMKHSFSAKAASMAALIVLAAASPASLREISRSSDLYVGFNPQCTHKWEALNVGLDLFSSSVAEATFVGWVYWAGAQPIQARRELVLRVNGTIKYQTIFWEKMAKNQFVPDFVLNIPVSEAEMQMGQNTLVWELRTRTEEGYFGGVHQYFKFTLTVEKY
jgi:hypothetical protein